MASDNLKQLGGHLRNTSRNASYAIKRAVKIMPKRDRVRDTISTISPFYMTIENDGNQQVVIDINFNKPPPNQCAAECIATACEDFELFSGGYSLQVTNPYEPNSVKVYSDGEVLNSVQWYEENPSGGQVYVQVQDSSAIIVICYAYIIC